jgi:hypothetical protein
MCILCPAKKAKSLTKMVISAYRSKKVCLDSLFAGDSLFAVEAKGARYTATRSYAAVPQPVDRSERSNTIDGYALHPSTINPNILKAQYAVRGELYNKAVEMAAKGDMEITYTNGGCGRECNISSCRTYKILS